MINLVGKTLGKYRIVGQLGQGGMAEVYKAYQPGLNRYVAIKVMHSHLSADPDFIGRFQREALARRMTWASSAMETFFNK